MELHYFLTTNGSAGHSDYLSRETERYRDVVYLSGFPRSLCTTLIRECYAIAKQNRMDIEIVHNCLDNSMEGIFLPALKTGLIGRPLYETRTDLAYLFKNDHLDAYKSHAEKAFAAFHEAKKVHDDWEKIYISATDYEALNRYGDSLLARLLDGHTSDRKGTCRDRFFGSATVDGSVDYVENLSAGLKRYFIKGRPGTGKSTFLKKLAQNACDRGFDAERYHCSFDPNSLDMVVVRELGFCVFDSTAPHEYFPTLESDEIFDFYAASVAPDTDEKYQAELSAIAARYKDLVGRAVKHLTNANNACLEAEKDSLSLLDQDRLLLIRKTIVQRLFP